MGLAVWPSRRSGGSDQRWHQPNGRNNMLIIIHLHAIVIAYRAVSPNFFAKIYTVGSLMISTIGMRIFA